MGFEKLQIVPTGSGLTTVAAFLLDRVLPPAWRENPVVYLISGFRWSFFEVADVNVGIVFPGCSVRIW